MMPMGCLFSSMIVKRAQIVLVEELEDFALICAGFDAEQWLHSQFGHGLIGGGEEQARDGDGAGELRGGVDQHDGVELLEVEFLAAHPAEDFVAGDGFGDEGKVGVHHAASGAGVEGEEFADFAGFLAGHFVHHFFEGGLWEIGQDCGGGVGSHFFEDVGGFAGVEFFDDLSGEAFVEFGEDGAGGFFVEGGDDALTLGGGEFFHDGGEVGGVEVFEFFVGDAEFYAAQWIGLDEIDELPADGALWKVGVEAAKSGGRYDALEKRRTAPGRPMSTWVRRSSALPLMRDLDQVDVIDADHFAAAGVDDLLIEEIFLDGEERFVGFVELQGALADVEAHFAVGHGGDLIVAGHQRGEMAAGEEIVGDAIGLIGRLDEKFADAPDEVALGVVGFGAHEFGGVEFHGFCFL